MSGGENLQKKLQGELEKYQAAQKDLQKYLSARQQLDAQLNENNMVKDELEKLEKGENVFKLIGPVLVKQELTEAKQNVQKRIEYITSEVKRHDNTIKDLEKTQESHRENLTKLQLQFQQAQVKAAARS
ncbi:prefoldin subunit 6-like [Liolophura sinensis]|uniref:prefoldin subunit 6-like n=1 Tax=Liolophura sinensis TaxID=3198878 RepID=UPI003158BA29